MDTLLQQLREAMNVMTMPGYSPEQISAADRWLFDFQRSGEAWQACDALLSAAPAAGDAMAAHMQFFAAQTMHAKVRSAFNDLSAEQAASLRETLFTHALNLPAERVRMRVGLALATLAVQMGSWTSIVNDIVGRLQAAPAVLAEVLRVLPEETDNFMVLVEPARRNLVKDELEEAAPRVLALVCSLQDQVQHEDIRKRVVLCIGSWVRCCRIEPEAMVALPAVPLVFSALSAPDVWDAAVDTVVELLRRYDGHQRNMPIVALLVPEAMKLEGLFDQAAPAAMEAGDPTAHDVVLGLTRIFTEMAESVLPMLFEEAEMNQNAVLRLVLKCTALPDAEVAGITLNFWYRFLTQLHSITGNERLVHKYTEPISALVDTCLRLMSFPDNYEELLEDGRQERRRFRHDIAATLDDCCRLTGARHCLQRAQAALSAAVAAAQSTPPVQAWKAVEAALFAMRSLGYQAERDGSSSDAVGAALALLPTLPETLPAALAPHMPEILYTSAMVVGGYAAWVAEHPDAVQPLFTFLLNCLPFETAEAAAAQGIRALCKLCGPQLGGEVVGVFQQHCRALSVTSQSLVLEGLSLVIAQMPAAQAAEAQRFLLNPVLAELEQLLAAGAACDEAAIVLQLERVAALFHRAPEANPQAVVDRLLEAQPLLARALQQHGARNKVSEHVCRVYKHALRAAGPSFRGALPVVAEQLVTSFKATGQSPFLYCASVCVCEFGGDPELAAALLGMMAAMSEATFQALTSLEAFTERPDLVEEYFFLVGRAVKHCLPSEWQPHLNLLVEAVKCACVGLQVDHADANHGVLYCLRQVIMAGVDAPEQPAVAAIFRPVVEHIVAPGGDIGAELVRQLVAGLAGGVPMPRVVADDDKHTDICKVLYELYCGFAAQLRAHLDAQLPAIGEAIAPRRLIDMFMADLFSAQVDWYTFRHCVREFGLVCRQNQERWG